MVAVMIVVPAIACTGSRMRDSSHRAWVPENALVSLSVASGKPYQSAWHRDPITPHCQPRIIKTMRMMPSYSRIPFAWLTPRDR